MDTLEYDRDVVLDRYFVHNFVDSDSGSGLMMSMVDCGSFHQFAVGVRTATVAELFDTLSDYSDVHDIVDPFVVNCLISNCWVPFVIRELGYGFECHMHRADSTHPTQLGSILRDL